MGRGRKAMPEPRKVVEMNDIQLEREIRILLDEEGKPDRAIVAGREIFKDARPDNSVHVIDGGQFVEVIDLGEDLTVEKDPKTRPPRIAARDLLCEVAEVCRAKVKALRGFR